MKFIRKTIITLGIVLSIFSCTKAENNMIVTKNKDGRLQGSNWGEVVKYTLPSEIKETRIIRVIPHDEKSYTQGLTFYSGYLYETTGKYGQSKIMKIDPISGEILKSRHLGFNIFGEGSTILDGKIYVLSWREGICFVYDIDSFNEVARFSYNTEGWGLSSDGEKLFMSDGGHKIRLINPSNFKVLQEIEIFKDGIPFDNINELEFIDGMLWANRWTEDKVYLINLQSGELELEIDLSILRTKLKNNSRAEVLNGIAYNKENGHFYFTGKNWSSIFEVVFD